jgi:hypothetical protein
MNRTTLAFALTLVLIAPLTVIACGGDDEPTEEEAVAALCGDLQDLGTAAGQFDTLSGGSTIAEVQDARDDVTAALDDVESSADDVSSASVDELQAAVDSLDTAVEGISDDQTIEEALAQLQGDIEAVATAGENLFTTLNCPAGETPASGATEEAPSEATDTPATAEPTAAEEPTVEAPTAEPTAEATAAPTAEATAEATAAP